MRKLLWEVIRFMTIWEIVKRLISPADYALVALFGASMNRKFLQLDSPDHYSSVGLVLCHSLLALTNKTFGLLRWTKSCWNSFRGAATPRDEEKADTNANVSPLALKGNPNLLSIQRLRPTRVVLLLLLAEAPVLQLWLLSIILPRQTRQV
ncbi:uncharacterized protein N7529_004624 [Penicillium soppii]|uniref:uncharacterized protein n=1 Tax=Penicillium soppii TaxID=69789 RepID=UPI00254793EB|nr:uncharacterized protein N7529_004624 [Penicillium soppii]KAJ5872271.1 hypothetical protein N7529_004624 [Penicillium soppii]